MAKKKTKKEHGVLKIYGTFEDVIAAAVSGNPNPKNAKKKKKK